MRPRSSSTSTSSAASSGAVQPGGPPELGAPSRAFNRYVDQAVLNSSRASAPSSLRVNSADDIEPAAERWTASPANQSTLPAIGLTFSDGAPLTSDDVVFVPGVMRRADP
jgi:ABC-type transport system substrate-binding protein